MKSRLGVPWAKIRTPIDWLAFLIATQSGVGLIRWGPGTWGTLLAVPIAYYVNYFPPVVKLFFWSMLLLVGIWAAARLSRLYGTSDHPQIVIDEGVGFGLSVFFLGPDLVPLLVAFVLFRFFDITKLPPVRQLDRWSKKALPGKTDLLSLRTGFGIMADDLLAAVQTMAVLYVLKTLMIF